jgi:protein-L-isoaspartate(D-aspartate) O-methyltransferase
MLAVPRHAFVPEGTSLDEAYENWPIPIGWGQTLSQPTVVAVMTEALELTGRERVLEVGTGSGYQSAILSLLAAEVFSIEIVPELAALASERLERMRCKNVHVRCGDGWAGWPERAPFDRVLVTAAPEELPLALTDQLAEGGILVAPIGTQERDQELVRVRKVLGELRTERLGPVRFVPMEHGA